MDSKEPEPAEGWPEGPLDESAAASLLDERADATAVWVMDHGAAARESVLGPDPPEDAVIDLIVETETGFSVYSYTHTPDGTRWMDYGAEEKGTPGGNAMAATLSYYRLLAGESTLS